MNTARLNLPHELASQLAGTDDLVINVDDSRWFSFETATNGERVLTLFVNCPWDVLGAAERALNNASVRHRSGSAIAVGIFRGALLMSLRLMQEASVPAGVERAAEELLRFSEPCMRP